MSNLEHLKHIEQSLLVAAYFRGGTREEQIPRSNSDQIVVLSLFYTGEISFTECAERFASKFWRRLYQDDGEHLIPMIESRYHELLALLLQHPELIEGFGNLETPADPTYTSCRLTGDGVAAARRLIPRLPTKPDFPDWPDNRTFP
jgi:hypothetical protein